MSEPTAAEQALAARWRLPAQQLAHARQALNHIASLDWPLPDRINLLARLAKGAGADVGPVYAGAALARAPLASFDLLLPIAGLGPTRVRGLVRALASLDMTALQVHAQALVQARQQVVALQAQLQSLRQELDRVYALLAEGERPREQQPMRVEEVTQSVMAQVRQADLLLMSGHSGLRLGGVALEVQGQAAQVSGELALDFASTQPRSRLSLHFEGARDPAAAAGGSAVPQVPNVVGYTESLARRKLSAAGLQILLVRDRSGTPRGVVRQQLPGAGGPLPADLTVRLLVG